MQGLHRPIACCVLMATLLGFAGAEDPKKAGEPKKGEAPKLVTDPPPRYCAKGKELIADDFTGNAPGKDWRVEAGKWTVKEGVLVGDVVKENEVPVLRRDVAAHDLIVQFQFRCDRSHYFTTSFGTAKGEVCHGYVTYSMVFVGRRPDEKSKEKDFGYIDAQPFDEGVDDWHTCTIEVCGKLIIMTMDDKVTTFGSDDAIDTDKTSIALKLQTAEGAVSFRSLRVWQAIPPADPAAAMKKVKAHNAASF